MTVRKKLRPVRSVVPQVIYVTPPAETSHQETRGVMSAATAFLKYIFSILNAFLLALIPVILGIVGLSAYERLQMENQKIQILETFLPHLAPEIDDLAIDGSEDKLYRDRLYLHRRQESERRYVALTALAQHPDFQRSVASHGNGCRPEPALASAIDWVQYQLGLDVVRDNQLLTAMAIQYPKEGLAATVLSGGDLHQQEEIVSSIVAKESLNMRVMNKQVVELCERLNLQRSRDTVFAAIGVWGDVTEGSNLAKLLDKESKYSDIDEPLLKFAIALVAYDLLQHEDAKSDCLAFFLAPSLTTFLVSHEEAENVLAPFERAFGNCEDSDLRPLVVDFSKRLLIETHAQALKQVKRLQEDTEEGQEISNDAVVKAWGSFVNSFESLEIPEMSGDWKSFDPRKSLGKLLPAARHASPKQLAGKEFGEFVCRLLLNEAKRIIQVSKKQRGWVSDEIAYLHVLGDTRIKELERLTKNLEFSKASKLKDIGIRFVELFGGLQMHGRLVLSRWNNLYSDFNAFMVAVDRPDVERKELDSTFDRLIESLDMHPGDESRRITDICVALYAARFKLSNFDERAGIK